MGRLREAAKFPGHLTRNPITGGMRVMIRALSQGQCPSRRCHSGTELALAAGSVTSDMRTCHCAASLSDN